MSKRLRNRKASNKSTLFFRIMLGLSIPLLCLTVIFAALQLSGDMKAIHRAYQIESRFAFEVIQRTLRLASHNAKTPESLKQITLELQKDHEQTNISIYDLFEKKIIVSSHTANWDTFDNEALESCLYEYQKEDKPYIVRANRKEEKLVAFIPLTLKDQVLRLVVRVQFPIPSLRNALEQSRGNLIAMILLMIAAGVAMGLKLSNSIVKPILKLNHATEEIMKGNLDQKVDIRTGDEIESLSNTFNKMSEAIKEMKKEAQDANPLSGLPGNQGIFKDLKRRLQGRSKFVLFHTDLDRFKVFNDHFGLARGDEAIVKTAELLKKAIRTLGVPDDFVGHQGGDDYVIIVNPKNAKEIAEYIVNNFNEEVTKKLYSKEDYDRGFILQLDRRRLAETGEEVMTEFPLLAVSLAGVSNVKKDFADYFDCMSAAVAVKKEVKAIIESSYLIKE